MNTATAEAPTTDLLINDEHVGSPVIHDQNPLEVRWGIQAALRNKPMSAFECGIAIVPFGRFFPIKSFGTKKENHTIDWTQAKEIDIIRNAAECELYLMEALGGKGAQNKTNYGLTVGFTGDTDVAKMAVISSAVLPKLSMIRVIGEELKAGPTGVSQVCEGSDDLDFGDREECPTCWLRWLQSPAIDAYLERVALQGMTVAVRNPSTGAIDERLVRPGIDELRTGKALAIEALKLGITQLEKDWRVIVGETGNINGRQVSDFEHMYRKDLHQNKPEDQQIAVAREAFRGAANAASGANDPRVDALLEAVGALVQLQTGGKKAAPAAAAAPPPAPAPVQVPETTVEAAPAVEAKDEDPEAMAPAAAKMAANKNKEK